MDKITASPADRAAVAEVLRTLGPVAVVRMVPVTTATATVTRRRTHVLLWDASGADLTDQLDAEAATIARDTVRAAFPRRVWTRDAYDYHAATGLLTVVTALRVPPGAVVPLADALADDAAGDDTARDFARSVEDGFVTPVDWDDDEPGDDPATLDLGRPVADVPVQDGGAL